MQDVSNVEVFHEDGSPLGDFKFRGIPLVGDVLLEHLPEQVGGSDVLVAISQRRWTIEGELQIIVKLVDIIE